MIHLLQMWILNNGALIDMTYASGFQKIETDDLQGVDGMFKLDIDASTNVDNSDRIYVKGMFTGSQYLDLNEVGHGTLMVQRELCWQQ